VIFLIACGLIVFAIVCVTGLVEAWARHRHWTGYDDHPLKYDRTRRMGKPW
jgi:hypothetical protein